MTLASRGGHGIHMTRPVAPAVKHARLMCGKAVDHVLRQAAFLHVSEGVVVDHVGVPHPRQHLHREDFLDRVLELDIGDRLPRAGVHHPYAATPLGQRLFRDGDAGQVIANSKMVRDEIVRRFGYPAERIHVVHNGVPPFTVPPEARDQTRRELGLRDGDFAVLFAGSGWERKGLRFAIEAMNAARLPNATLLVAGRGNERAMPRSGRVRFLGPVKDMPRHLAAADAFILPTLYDPFSNACLEALAAGLPVITTAHNGFAEIIAPGVEGEVVAQPDDIVALAGALEKWSDPARRAAIRPRLLALGAQFSITENVRQTLAIIEQARV